MDYIPFRVIFDGGSKNGTHRGYGSMIVFHHGMLVVHKHFDYGDDITNVMAEYMTLISTLEYIIENYDARELSVDLLGDSELVRHQVGIKQDEIWYAPYQVRKPHLLPLRNRSRDLLDKLGDWSYHYLNETVIKKVLGH